MMWERYIGFLEVWEPLLSMAYFCLSVLNRSTGLVSDVRPEVANRYKIDMDVLNKLGRITSTRGAAEEARKLDQGATGTELTHQERVWVDQVVKRLIRRKAEYDADPPPR